MARRLYAHPERVAAPAPDPRRTRRRSSSGCADLIATRSWSDALPELGTPTLVLFGTRDAVIAPAMGRVYKDLLPNAHLVLVYDAGHAISAERPEAFAEVVTDFLERREAFVISRANTIIHP